MMRRVLSAIVCSAVVVVLSAGVAVAQAPRVVDTTLPNGMRVVVAPDPLAPIVTTVLTYAAGSDEETMPGQAHALEHMMFRGTTGVTATQFSEIAARMGASYNANTTNDATTYYFTAPSAYLGIVLRLEADRMQHLALRPDDWVTERGAIEQEVRGDESSPTFSLQQQVREALYGGTPYARDALGTIESFDKMTVADLRAFYDTWYHPNDATLIIAGNVNPVEVMREVQADFAAIPSGKLPARPSVTLQPLAPKRLSVAANIPTGGVAYAYRFPGITSPDYPAAQVLVSALDNPRGAFADLAVSGKVLGAGVSASTSPHAGTATVFAGVRPGGATNAALDVLQSTLSTYLKNGVPDDAVQTAKRRILLGQAFELTSVNGVASNWTSALRLGLSRPDALLARYEAVTTADVDRVLRSYLGTPNRLSIAVTAKSTPGSAAAASGAGGENVAYHATSSEPLPDWAEAYFRAPLRVPKRPRATTYVLPNGIRIAVIRVQAAPVVVLRGSIKNNPTLYAPPGKEGVAEVTDDLMHWGSKTLDRKAFSAALDAIPASASAGLSFSLASLAKNFDATLALLSDELLHPAFPENGFDVIKQNYGGLLQRDQARPPWRAQMALEAGLYPAGDPVRRHPNASAVASLTLRDVRAWYGAAFRPDETSIVVVGDVAPATVRAAIAKYLGTWRARGPKPTFHYPKIALNKPASSVVTSDTEHQTEVQLSQILAVHQDDVAQTQALNLADMLLAHEGPSSLLFHDLRERLGYAYGVDSTLDVGIQRSTYSFDFASDPKNADKAFAALLADIEHLQKQPVSNDDLNRAKATFLAGYEMSQSSYGGVAGTFLDELSRGKKVSGLTAHFDKEWSTMLSTTPDQVRAAIAKWVRPKDFVQVRIVPATAPASP